MLQMFALGGSPTSLPVVGFQTGNKLRRPSEMEPMRVSLCPHCTECPEVVISDEGVTIGEDANIVRLSHAEWNELVMLIKRGEVREI
jgi:hypothetical protein